MEISTTTLFLINCFIAAATVSVLVYSIVIANNKPKKLELQIRQIEKQMESFRKKERMAPAQRYTMARAYANSANHIVPSWRQNPIATDENGNKLTSPVSATNSRGNMNMYDWAPSLSQHRLNQQNDLANTKAAQEAQTNGVKSNIEPDDNKEVADTSGSPVKTQNGLTDSGNPNNRSEVSPFIAHFTATSSLKPKSTVSETFFRGV